MGAYIVRRLLLIVPTLFGIILINFLVVQAAPGGPVERIVAEIAGNEVDATSRFTSAGADSAASQQQRLNQAATGGEAASKYRGARGLDPDLIKEIERMYGMDKPIHIRFFLMVKSYLMFDFGESFFIGRKVVDLVIERLPVSMSLGLWTTLIVYMVSIPLGIVKAARDGSRFDLVTSGFVTVGYAVPGFLFALLLIVFFAGGRYFSLFPLQGLVSDNWSDMGFFMKIADYLWHLALPVSAMVIGGFATLTLLTKNSFIDQIRLQYVVTARAKGLTEKRVLYGHIFRNAMLIVIAGFPGAFISVFFTSSLLIEVIFSLNGLGLLGYEAAINRDYPIVFATLYFFSLLGLLTTLVSDLTYAFVDPRIDFETREV